MATSTQHGRNRFTKGSGVYKCRLCEHSTRDTGDNGSVSLCPICYDLAGEDNSLSDSGKFYGDDVPTLVEALDKQAGPGTAQRLFPRIVAKLAAPAPQVPAGITKPPVPRIYSILDFCLSADGKTLTHELHLVAACSQKEAIAQAHHEGISTHRYCFITTDLAANMGGSTMKNVTALRTDTVSVEAFEHWVRQTTKPFRDSGEQYPAVYSRLD